jgi:hypothetical protein
MSEQKHEQSHRAGAFDIRTFIAMLIGLYGVVLVITGIVATSDADLDKTDGLNLNLWAGIGMVVVAAAMQGWAMWRPIVVPESREGDDAP